MSESPLSPDQRRAAAMLAAGRSRDEAAAELGVAPKTLSRWKERGEFRALIRRTREGLVPDAPTAEATLVAALAATRPDGEPDWQARIAAAKALLSLYRSCAANRAVHQVQEGKPVDSLPIASACPHRRVAGRVGGRLRRR